MKRIALAVMLGLCACDGTRNSPGLTDAEFIATMAELRQAAQAAGTDTAQFDSARDEVLKRHGVTEAELRAFVEWRGRDLRALAEVWDSVGARLVVPR